ncbi:MAG: hypothetical protein FWE23_04375 [Chitinivibrionia bacterium]|nr:hypothetical protein [Chitinivibrionia bacterium]
MRTMNGVYDGKSVKLNRKCELNQRCNVVVIFSENYKPVKRKISPLDNLLGKINNNNIHEEADFGVREGNEVW